MSYRSLEGPSDPDRAWEDEPGQAGELARRQFSQNAVTVDKDLGSVFLTFGGYAPQPAEVRPRPSALSSHEPKRFERLASYYRGFGCRRRRFALGSMGRLVRTRRRAGFSRSLPAGTV